MTPWTLANSQGKRDLLVADDPKLAWPGRSKRDRPAACDCTGRLPIAQTPWIYNLYNLYNLAYVMWCNGNCCASLATVTVTALAGSMELASAGLDTNTSLTRPVWQSTVTCSCKKARFMNSTLFLIPVAFHLQLLHCSASASTFSLRSIDYSWRPLSSTFCHDDVIKWKHFPCCWPFVREIHRSSVSSRTKAIDADLDVFLYVLE